LEIWLYPDQVQLLKEEWKREGCWDSIDLSESWSTPSDFIADFRQALDSLLTNGDLEFKHIREYSLGEKVADAAATFGCLAVLILLWFSFCAAG
jgi:hypothetical protein